VTPLPMLVPMSCRESGRFPFAFTVCTLVCTEAVGTFLPHLPGLPLPFKVWQHYSAVGSRRQRRLGWYLITSP